MILHKQSKNIQKRRWWENRKCSRVPPNQYFAFLEELAQNNPDMKTAEALLITKNSFPIEININLPTDTKIKGKFSYWRRVLIKDRNYCNAKRIRSHQQLNNWRFANQHRKIIEHRSRIHIHSDKTAPIRNMMKLAKKASSSLLLL